MALVLGKLLHTVGEVMKFEPGRERHWNRLVLAADEEVRAVRKALPAPLRTRSRDLPVTYEPAPSRALIESGIEDDTLGLFVGEAFTEEYSGVNDLPAQVILFLENIWEYADHDAATYRDEVRRTLLHELGHFLGLDEGDLEERDLD
jgi:predicted Zn-dependent protease with MMP-like domain